MFTLLLGNLHGNFTQENLVTDKETDESWGHIYNMKNQFWAGLGSWASTVKKKVWGRLWATFEARFFMFSWAKNKFKICLTIFTFFLCNSLVRTLQYFQKKLNLFFVHENLKNGPQMLLIISPKLFFSQYWPDYPNQCRIDFSYYKYVPRLICLLICDVYCACTVAPLKRNVEPVTHFPKYDC